MAIKAISQFDAATPTTNDKILFEQNGEGKNCSIGDAVNTCSLTLEEIQARTDLTGNIASASALKEIGIKKIYKFRVPLNHNGNYTIIQAGANTYVGYPMFVSAYITPPLKNADYGGYTWIQAYDAGSIIIRHTNLPETGYGEIYLDVMVFIGW